MTEILFKVIGSMLRAERYRAYGTVWPASPVPADLSTREGEWAGGASR